MSFAVDVNILLYASDASSPHHAKAQEFLESCAAGEDVWCLAWPTLLGYLRMATHPAIFRSPLNPEIASRNVEALLALPHVRIIGEGEGFWTEFQRAARGIAPRGNAVPDIHLAAILLASGVKRFYTNDADFRRFDFLDVRNPLE